MGRDYERSMKPVSVCSKQCNKRELANSAQFCKDVVLISSCFQYGRTVRCCVSPYINLHQKRYILVGLDRDTLYKITLC